MEQEYTLGGFFTLRSISFISGQNSYFIYKKFSKFSDLKGCELHKTQHFKLLLL